MNAHKEAAKQRKRKSLKMALEKCMQRRDAMVAETTTTSTTTTGAGGDGAEAGETGDGAGSDEGAAGSEGTEPPLTYEQQQQRMHHELTQQIRAAMAAEQAAEAMDSTMNTTVNTTTTTATTTTNTTGTTSDGCSDAEASDGSDRPMEVDEDQPPEPQPGSELVVVEPKIEVLSESEDDEEDRLHMSEAEPDIQAEAIYDHMPNTPTSPPHIIPPNETPTLTSTPKVNVEQ